MQNKIRPLSPHISIYKPQVSSVISILHRISGIANFIGLLILTWWVIILGAYGFNPEDTVMWDFLSSTFGLLLLMGLSLSIIFHMYTGVRHLFWDIGIGFKKSVFPITGYLALPVAIGLCAILWLVIFFGRG
jgi:succinate dehydrogenase / fumarate reductase cytochrome b subunit